MLTIIIVMSTSNIYSFKYSHRIHTNIRNRKKESKAKKKIHQFKVQSSRNQNYCSSLSANLECPKFEMK
ncbi:hypothetical protein DERF_005602 [Dermatophagoides farinae]|uniref:Uncharacterized protein n=1 Tax=Dermatophagoides farinae TaxID=6954 RepID=A0A922I669_DERFA|nr:hypothetical protein DERF_005602 [Dermatophagoides farinae]